jgi:hypothetical protein
MQAVTYMYSQKPKHLAEEQRKVLRQPLTYRRAIRAGKHQDEAVDAAIAEYRQLSSLRYRG